MLQYYDTDSKLYLRSIIHDFLEFLVVLRQPNLGMNVRCQMGFPGCMFDVTEKFIPLINLTKYDTAISGSAVSIRGNLTYNDAPAQHLIVSCDRNVESSGALNDCTLSGSPSSDTFRVVRSRLVRYPLRGWK